MANDREILAKGKGTVHYSEIEPPLDPGIANAVKILQEAGVETFESCQGGDGHSYREPAVRFHGQQYEGMRVLAVAQMYGLPVRELRRVWRIEDGEPNGPWWELTFQGEMRGRE